MDLIPHNGQQSYLEGPNHQTQAVARAMERRGEIVVQWNAVRVRQSGRTVVPYVRIVPHEVAARARHARAAGWGLIGVLGLGSLLAALWEARWIVFGSVMLWLSIKMLRHRPACPGLHCPGCHK